ncbi:MAG: hypothetical protein ACRCZF_02205 [Gemmataceae bacterium]
MIDTLPASFGIQGMTINEPCAGQRDIVRVLEHNGLTVNHSDLTDGPGNDATTRSFWESRPPFDLMITNPAFNVATPIVQLGYEFAKVGAIVLLPQSWFEPTENKDGSNKAKGLPSLYDKSLFAERYQWLCDHADQMRWQVTVNPRPMFREDTTRTDSKTVCWTLWDKRWSWMALGIEPPFRFIRGMRDRANPRITRFPDVRPKLTLGGDHANS